MSTHEPCRSSFPYIVTITTNDGRTFRLYSDDNGACGPLTNEYFRKGCLRVPDVDGNWAALRAGSLKEINIADNPEWHGATTLEAAS